MSLTMQVGAITARHSHLRGRMRALAVIVLCCIRSLVLVAQLPLPYFEVWDHRGLLLARDSALFGTAIHDTPYLLRLGPQGMDTLAVTHFTLVTEDECCTDDEPTYLLAEMEDVPDTAFHVMLPPSVFMAEHFSAVRADPVLLPDTLLPLTDDGSGLVHRWIWQPSEGDARPAMQRLQPDGTVSDTWDHFLTKRSSCMGWTINDLCWVVCPAVTDTMNYYATAGLNILLHGTDVVHVFIDHSGTTIDGYGPFHYTRRRPVALLRRADVRGVYFNSGEVLLNENGRWRLAHREPLRYYGECDCPED